VVRTPGTQEFKSEKLPLVLHIPGSLYTVEWRLSGVSNTRELIFFRVVSPNGDNHTKHLNYSEGLPGKTYTGTYYL